MGHARLYDESDPVLARLRTIALALPEAREVEAWGRPTFRAKKIFALYEDTGLTFKPAPGERDMLVHERRVTIPPYWGPSGWLALSLAGDVDWEEVRELVTDSYRQVALVRMLKALDGS